jgi:DNA repair exonuclease SbcCD ATPase subunit
VKDIKRGLEHLKSQYDHRRGQRDALLSRLEFVKARLEENRNLKNLKREAVVLIEAAGQSARESITERISAVVTFALQSVFGDDYRFVVKNTLKRNAVWTDFAVGSKLYEASSPIESRGGGVVDVVSLALRAVLLELFTPAIAGPLILDEPTKHLSKEYGGRMAELLGAITSRMQRQVILVTHDAELAKEAETRFTV